MGNADTRVVYGAETTTHVGLRYVGVTRKRSYKNDRTDAAGFQVISNNYHRLTHLRFLCSGRLSLQLNYRSLINLFPLKCAGTYAYVTSVTYSAR